MNKDFYSTKEFADQLGVSRVAVFKQIKSGKINAQRVGRSYVIPRDQLRDVSRKPLSKQEKKVVEMAVKKVVKEYGEALRLLGKE